MQTGIRSRFNTHGRPHVTYDKSRYRLVEGHVTTSLPADIKHLSWAAEQLGIGTPTAYRLVAAGEIPGAFKVRAQWGISVPDSWPRFTARRTPVIDLIQRPWSSGSWDPKGVPSSDMTQAHLD